VTLAICPRRGLGRRAQAAMPSGRPPRAPRTPRAAAAARVQRAAPPRGRVLSPRAVQHELAALDMLASQVGTPTASARASPTGNKAAPRVRAQNPVPSFPGEERVREDPCGVGLTLKRTMMDAEFEVESIHPDGPIDATGRVRVGDKVVEVDGVPVEGKPFEIVCKMLRGGDGSWAHVVFERESRFCYNISVQRTPERNFSRAASPSSRLGDRLTDNAYSQLPISAEPRVTPTKVFECSGAETRLTRRGDVSEESMDSDGTKCRSLLLWAAVYLCVSALSFCICAKVNTGAGFEDWPEIGDWSVALCPLWVLNVLGAHPQCTLVRRCIVVGWPGACHETLHSAGQRVALAYGNIFAGAFGVLFTLKHDSWVELPDVVLWLPLIIGLSVFLFLNCSAVLRREGNGLPCLSTAMQLLMTILAAASLALHLSERSFGGLPATRAYYIILAPLALASLLIACAGVLSAIKKLKDKDVHSAGAHFNLAGDGLCWFVVTVWGMFWIHEDAARQLPCIVLAPIPVTTVTYLFFTSLYHVVSEGHGKAESTVTSTCRLDARRVVTDRRSESGEGRQAAARDRGDTERVAAARAPSREITNGDREQEIIIEVPDVPRPRILPLSGVSCLQRAPERKCQKSTVYIANETSVYRSVSDAALAGAPTPSPRTLRLSAVLIPWTCHVMADEGCWEAPLGAQLATAFFETRGCE